MVNGRRYVGQTVQPLKRRFNENVKGNYPIGRAIRKYGKENFYFSQKMQGVRNFTERDKAKLEEFFGKPADYLLECNF